MSIRRPIRQQPIVNTNLKSTESWAQYIEYLLQYIEALEARIEALETP